MDWLTENKIPVGKVAADGFDWLDANGAAAFDALSDALEAMIDAILWILQTPHPLVVVGAFAAIAWVLQRKASVVVLVVLGFLFILNQGYWEETTESLTLVLSACVLCMGVGAYIGSRHQSSQSSSMRPPWSCTNSAPKSWAHSKAYW